MSNDKTFKAGKYPDKPRIKGWFSASGNFVLNNPTSILYKGKVFFTPSELKEFYNYLKELYE